MYTLDVTGLERHINDLDQQARAALDTAILSTIGYILSIRDGSCYRYEKEIAAAEEEARRSKTRLMLAMREKRDNA